MELTKEVLKKIALNPADAAQAVWLYERFIEGSPITLLGETPPKDPYGSPDRSTSTNWRDGRLYSKIKHFKVGWMLGHELGHIFAATDEELFLPNMGMVDGDTSLEQATKEQYLAEATVVAAQMVFLNTKDVPNEARIRAIGGQVWGVSSGSRENWLAFYEAEKVRLAGDVVPKELDRKIKLLKKAAKSAKKKVAA